MIDTNTRISVSASFNRAAQIVAAFGIATEGEKSVEQTAVETVDRIARQIYKREHAFIEELANEKQIAQTRSAKHEDLGLDNLDELPVEQSTE